MLTLMYRNITFVCLTLSLINCQNLETKQPQKEITALSSDNGQLDLSQSSIEEQKIQKENALILMSAARQKRIVITPEQLKEISSDIDLNIAVYARSTNNPLGKKLYQRLTSPHREIDPCLRFNSSEDSQRYFLFKGGPEKDIWGLDPDGDGFACNWDPKYYRLISLN